MVRNKKDKTFEREMLYNSREAKLPETHITTLSFDKVSERPPIARADRAPNPLRFEPFNVDPKNYTKVKYAA
jgi:hypothetical protein